MKVYFTLTDGVEDDELQLDMLELSLKTVKKNTNLDIYALYDGSVEDEAYKIFMKYGAKVTICKSSLEQELQQYYGDVQLQQGRLGLKRLLGCFMKFDIANYEKEDDVVLYLDIDTIVLKNYNWDDFKSVKTIAVAPEFNPNYDIIKGERYFSAGIMVINIKEACKRYKKLKYMLEHKLEPYQECWDQGFWNELYKNDFEELPIEFNWKPYWGVNNNAYIIHVHGFKFGKHTSSEIIWFTNLMQKYKNALLGTLYYFQLAFRILEKSKDKELYIADLADKITKQAIKFSEIYKVKMKIKKVLINIIPIKKIRQSLRKKYNVK